MRTNIEIDDELMAEVQEMSRLSTKRAVVDAALRDYRRRLAILQLFDMRGKVEFFAGYTGKDDEEPVDPLDARREKP